MSAAQASTAASIQLLDAALQMSVDLSAQLLESMRAASPTGSGGSIDTWA